MTAWILRFLHNSRNKSNRRNVVNLSVTEIEEAEKKIVKLVQLDAFEMEKASLKSLNTFHDKQGILRVRTKLTMRDDVESFKCPIILPSNHKLIRLLIQEEHVKMCHAGLNILLSTLRERFWILKGRKTVKSVIHKCVRCRRHEAKNATTVPATLPEDRVKDASVFEVVGVDLAGPLILKNGEKAWILLFTCAVYRAVHIELIMSLSTNGFMLGFRRFIARRGRPKIIYSDNGTNFVGADNLLRSIDWKRLEAESSVFKIQWKFSPPTAPWWGGFWERLIQILKKLLRRVLGRASLHYEEMQSILCDCESAINSRPLTYLSEDPKDLIPLTPAMFLQDITTVGIPDLDHLDRVNLSKRFQYLQRLRVDLRKRFRNEYLSLLLQSPGKNSKEVKSGDIVIIGSDEKKRIDWPIARIVQVYKGKDGHTRVARVKTATNEMVRPVKRLYPLEISSSTDSKQDFLVTNDLLTNEKGEVVTTRIGRQVRRPSRYSSA